MKTDKEICVIGDIHGCYEELQELLVAINYNPSRMRVIFAGDLGDRGPNSIEVVWFIRSLCEKGLAECILGNHENLHVRYRGHEIRKVLTGKDNPMRAMSPNDLDFHRKLTDSDISWMRKLPLTIHIKGSWFAIHGGLEPAFNFNNQSPEQIIRCRYVSDGKHTTVSGKIIPRGRAIPMENLAQPKDSVYWAEMWDGPQSIVYGHCVHSLNVPFVSKRPGGVKCVGIDTGCVFGGYLTAFFPETEDFVKVKAKRAYSMQFNE